MLWRRELNDNMKFEKAVEILVEKHGYNKTDAENELKFYLKARKREIEKKKILNIKEAVANELEPWVPVP